MSNYELNQIDTVLSAGVPARIAPRNPTRNSLYIMNAGAAAASLRFLPRVTDNVLPTVGKGWALDPPAATGGQGGYLAWAQGFAPVNEVWAISTAGTTITVMEG